MSKELERAADLSPFLEDSIFLGAFCGGCPLAPKLYFEECPAGGDPRDRDCPRRWCFHEIERIIEGAQTDIVITMREAGCVA